MSGETGRGTGRGSEVQRCRKGNGGLSSRDCMGPAITLIRSQLPSLTGGSAKNTPPLPSHLLVPLLGPPESPAQRGICFSVPKETLGVSTFFIM